MDRISDSGSDGCGSIPHGGTKKGLRPLSLYPVYPQSLRDSPGGACRPFAFAQVGCRRWFDVFQTSP